MLDREWMLEREDIRGHDMRDREDTRDAEARKSRRIEFALVILTIIAILAAAILPPLID